MTTIDPIALEVLWSRLLSVTNEQQAALMRTAFSTVVRESQDLACGVFDTAGNMVAQSETGTPGHINAVATCMRHFMAAYPERTLESGDVLITNDPWMTAGQINDVTLVTPIFRDGRVVAYFANTCHMLDIGGRILSAEAREVYEEGLYIPITKLFQQIESACQPLGVSREGREYKPHVTLARFRRPNKMLTARTLIRMIDPSLLPAPPFTANNFTLFQSKLDPTGAIHTPVATIGA